MSATIDKFTEGLRVNLTHIESQLHGLQTDLNNHAKKDAAAIRASLDAARTNVENTRSHMKAAQEKAQIWIKAKQEAGSAVIQGWKDKLDREQLDRHAERAEDNAVSANLMAQAAVADAAVATYEAMQARLAAHELKRS
jgi:hypothetical protein